jgi:CRISPR-associated endonuclease Cas1
MPRHCDPIDIPATLLALAAGKPRRIIYAEYASVAAVPYARASWEVVLRQGRQQPPPPKPKSRLHAIVEDGGPIKPSTVLALVSDAPSLTIKGGALHVHDGPLKLVYERRSEKPEAIVTTGWSGALTIDAIRFCADHKIAFVVLDWSRDLMSVVATPAPRSANLLKRQCAADPLPIARAIIAAKIGGHAREGALSPDRAAHWTAHANAKPTIASLVMTEAHAASEAWSKRHVQIRWREAGALPKSWKLAYAERRRMGARSAYRAIDPINSLLNLALGVTAGRLTVALAAHGLSPAVGFIHKSPRWPLTYDAVELLRPRVERLTFDFIDRTPLSPRDFIIENGTQAVKTTRPMTRRFLGEASLSMVEIDKAADWLTDAVMAGDGKPL